MQSIFDKIINFIYLGQFYLYFNIGFIFIFIFLINLYKKWLICLFI